MADGDDAAAAGLATVASTALVTNGYKEINKSRDYVARHGTGALLAHAISHITGLAAALANAATATTGTSSRPVNTSGSGDFVGSLKTVFGWSYEVTGTRRDAVMDVNGVIGWQSSSGTKKQDIELAEFTAEQLRGIQVCFYKYIVEVEKERTGLMPDGSPITVDTGRRKRDRKTGETVSVTRTVTNYRAATEIGVVAEQLHELGLWPFVVYEGRGKSATPISVHYALLGMAAIKLAQLAYDEIDAIKERLDRLETKP